MSETLQRAKATSAIAAAWGLFSALALLMLGNGLLSSLLGIRAEIEGFATRSTGLIMASYFAGFLFGSRLAPRVLERVGHVRVFAALASLASAAPLVHAVFITPLVWALMRLVFGFCMAGLYVVAESWLNQAADNTTRGRLLSVYMVVMMGGYAVSQAFLGVAVPSGFALFVLSSLFVSLSVVPISLSQGNAPAFRAPETLQFATVWRLAPVGVIGGIGSGVATGALVGMGAVYATRLGYSTGQVAWLMGAALLGSVLLQWPIGLLSDRIPRRRALLIITMVAAGIAFIGAQPASPTFAFLIVVMLLFGSFSYPLYSVALSHINDVVSPNQAVAVSSIYVFAAGLGAIFGPLGAAVAIDSVGPAGFFWVLAITHGMVGLFAMLRITTRPAPVSPAEQRPWRPFPARASAVITRLTKVRRGDPGESQALETADSAAESAAEARLGG